MHRSENLKFNADYTGEDLVLSGTIIALGAANFNIVDAYERRGGSYLETVTIADGPL